MKKIIVRITYYIFFSKYMSRENSNSISKQLSDIAIEVDNKHPNEINIINH